MSELVDERSRGLSTPFHEAAATAVRTAMAEIERNWQGTLNGNDVEAVHDLRVGTRRLRAALSVYEHAFPPDEFRRVERAMALLTDSLGPARDTDVLIEHLQTVIKALGDSNEAEQHGIRSYIKHLQQLRSRQQEALDRSMSKIDLAKVVKALDSV